MLAPKDLRIPHSWQIIAGADTGTYMGGAICAITPIYDLYILEEFPNYRYTGDGTIELTGMTVGEWIKWFALRLRYYTRQTKVQAWVDANTTFKTEIAHGLRFKMNRKDLELRTEITREYLRHGRIHLTPWLETIPYEMEEAHYPEAESIGTGRYRRIKQKDHCLDGVEHACSRRPHPDFAEFHQKEAVGIAKLLEQSKRPEVRESDYHMGQL